MKSALRRLFNKSSLTTTAQFAIIKQEDAFYCNGKYKSPKCPSLNNKAKTLKHSPLKNMGKYPSL